VTAVSGLTRILAEIHPALLRYLRARGATTAEAEDVLQDVYLTLAERRSGPIDEPRAYLYRTATNRLFDHRRTTSRRERREQAWVEVTTDALSERDDRPSAETQSIDRERLSIVERHLDLLPERTATIFRRFRINGEVQRSIAADFGISISAVEKHLQNAYRAVLAAKADLDAEPVAVRRLLPEGKR